MPDFAYLYGLPYELYKRYGIRRYGFHGMSHSYIAQQTSEVLGKPKKRLKIISCHLGNGCSISAIERGKSLDTSMGFTPLEGLVMGTRCGDIDPAAVLYLMKKRKLSPDQADAVLNKSSGLLGLSGKSNDMRDLLKLARRGNKRANCALEVFIYRVKKYIGAYIAAPVAPDTEERCRVWFHQPPLRRPGHLNLFHGWVVDAGFPQMIPGGGAPGIAGTGTFKGPYELDPKVLAFNNLTELRVVADPGTAIAAGALEVQMRGTYIEY